MPYIHQRKRYELAGLPWDNLPDLQAGEMNYVITGILIRALKRRPVSFAAIAEIIGVLEAAKLELYRRLAAPYEDGKAAENGDVYK